MRLLTNVIHNKRRKIEKMSMPWRSILIFPKISTAVALQRVREHFDPLVSHIRPHISLVFPFQSEISDTILIAKVTQIISGTSAFPAAFTRLGHDDNGYIWLEADQGRDTFTKLHDQLYSDPVFAPFLRRDIPFQPHITIAKVNQGNTDKIIAGIKIQDLCFSTLINAISIERVAANNDSDEFAKMNLISGKQH
ncbi:2'-5' RNA ligase family protein [Oenococcus sp.]|uniref:2'-5' RNA ligase family protein n=1 Tax=Oenococcus sp. TaxID=1979414 RepID=UPI0039E8D3A2